MQQLEIMLDAQAIAALRALQVPGRPSILLRVMDLFASSAQALVAELEQALESGDLPTIMRAAHTLKSSSANIGATELAAHSKRIEQCGRDGDLDGCRRHAEGFKPLFDATLVAVAALRGAEAA
jgi:HPt (histidine-containing phosphotransfer) domain-containing protein